MIMGFSMNLSFAIFFSCHHESNWLNNYFFDFKATVYKRYADDCFLLFLIPSQVQPFLNYLNSQHINTKLTLETEINNRLNFWVPTVYKDILKFFTFVLRKLTATLLSTYFFIFIPLIFKSKHLYLNLKI